MQKCFGVLCVSLVLCATLSETFGLVLSAKEKRGWTLNSAGYLLGPRRIEHLIQIKDSPSARGREEPLGEYAVDNHRSLSDKHGLAGKRELQLEDDIKSEMGALDNLHPSLTSEEVAQP
uniref:Galanin/GMAP prepropeptide n=1 Tax=Lepisosteus oculatus TaxID=7918 RepID=W5M3H8_LEPOC